MRLSFPRSTALRRIESAISGIAADIKTLLGSFQKVKVLKINRTGNQVAHCLASLGRSELSGGVFIGSFPPCVAGMIISDCNQTVPS